MTASHDRPLISELLSSPPSMITRLYLSFRDRSKVGSGKLVYLGPRSFLVEGHRYRSKKFYTFFDGKAELHSTPVKRDGHYIFKMVRTIQVSYGKVTKDGKKKNRDKAPIEGVPFKKQSIFYKYLPY